MHTALAVSKSRLGEQPTLRKQLRKRLRDRAPTPMREELIEQARRPLLSGSPLMLWGAAVTVGIVGLQLGMVLIDTLDGGSVGDACERHGHCETDLCLTHLHVDARYCSKPCRGDAECLPGHRCGDPTTLPEAQRGIGAAGPLASGSVCVRP